MEKAKKCYGMWQSVFLITNPKPIIFLFTPNEIYCKDCIATTSLCRCVWSWIGGKCRVVFNIILPCVCLKYLRFIFVSTSKLFSLNLQPNFAFFVSNISCRGFRLIEIINPGMITNIQHHNLHNMPKQVLAIREYCSLICWNSRCHWWTISLLQCMQLIRLAMIVFRVVLRYTVRFVWAGTKPVLWW